MVRLVSRFETEAWIRFAGHALTSWCDPQDEGNSSRAAELADQLVLQLRRRRSELYDRESRERKAGHPNEAP